LSHGAGTSGQDEYTQSGTGGRRSLRSVRSGLKVGDRIVGVGQGENSHRLKVMGSHDDTVSPDTGPRILRLRLMCCLRKRVLTANTSLFHLFGKDHLDKQAPEINFFKKGLKGRAVATRAYRRVTLPGFYLDFALPAKGRKQFQNVRHGMYPTCLKNYNKSQSR